MIRKRTEERRAEWLGYVTAGQPHLLREAVSHVHPADQADVLRTLENGVLASLLEVMEDEQLRGLVRFLHTDKNSALKILESLPDTRRAFVLEPFRDEDIAALVAGLPAGRIAAVVGAMPPPRIEAVRKLAAGGLKGLEKIMTRDYLCVRTDDTVKEVMSTMLSIKHSEGRPAQMYVTDSRGILRGVVELHSLMLADGARKVEEVMQECPLRIPAGSNALEASRSILYYGLASGPVVDRTNQLVGVITADSAYRLLERRLESSLNRIGALGGMREGQDQKRTFEAVSHALALLPIIGATLAACLLLNLLLKHAFHAETPEMFLFAWAPLSIAMARLYYWHVTILLQRFDPADPATAAHWRLRVRAGIAAGAVMVPMCAWFAWLVSDSARMAVVAAAGLAWAIVSGSMIAWLLYGTLGRLKLTERPYFTPAVLSAGDFAALAFMALLFYLIRI